MNMMVNAVRRLENMFPGYFAEAKHNHYKDFGYPKELDFSQFYAMYDRNGMAEAGIKKTILKTWEDNPSVWEQEDPKESTLEADIRQRFADLRVWQNLAEADLRYLVGGYAGVIFRFGDDKRFNEPVDGVTGGLDGLVEVIPAWAGQLMVSEWETNETSESYGKPKMYAFNEAAVGASTGKGRSFDLHPDRVLIWSHDRSTFGRSILRSGYNSLLDMEKISGAGGEGFYKNAKSSTLLELDKEAKIDEIARSMGVPVGEVADKIDEQMDDFNRGFDASLMLQGMTAKTLPVSMISPQHFFNVALQTFAASIDCPQKILVGNQSGERASTEDSAEWAKSNMSRRDNIVRPNILDFVNRLERVGILPERDWHLDWTDLTESSMGEKIERAEKMAKINASQYALGEPVYTGEEIRDVTGYSPIEWLDDDLGDDPDA